ncbi:MAG: tetratricopeptide repeat protein [Spirochaetia bacterium]|nr:tetratricopeptide repeat protein [Spirochaetia bacterium]
MFVIRSYIKKNIIKDYKFIRFFALIFVYFFQTHTVYSVEELDNADVEYIGIIYDKALEKYNMQKYEASLEDIRHVIKSDMTNYNLRYLAAHNHWRLGNYDSAIAHFETAMNKNSQKPGSYIDLSLLYLQLKNYKASKKILLKGIDDLNAANTSVPSKVYNILSRLSFYEGNFTEALEYAQEAKAIFNQNKAGIKDKLEAVILEARAHLELKNFEKAELSALWALNLKKDNPYAYNLLGYIYEKWANTVSDENKKQELLKKSKENYEITIHNSNNPENLNKLIQENINRIITP